MAEAITRKTPQEQAEELFAENPESSWLELGDAVKKVMEKNGDDPKDQVIKGQISKHFRILKEAA